MSNGDIQIIDGFKAQLFSQSLMIDILQAEALEFTLKQITSFIDIDVIILQLEPLQHLAASA